MVRALQSSGFDWRWNYTFFCRVGAWSCLYALRDRCWIWNRSIRFRTFRGIHYGFTDGRSRHTCWGLCWWWCYWTGRGRLTCWWSWWSRQRSSALNAIKCIARLAASAFFWSTIITPMQSMITARTGFWLCIDTQWLLGAAAGSNVRVLIRG